MTDIDLGRPGASWRDATVIASCFVDDADGKDERLLLRLRPTAPFYEVGLWNMASTPPLRIGPSELHLNINDAAASYADNGGDI